MGYANKDLIHAAALLKKSLELIENIIDKTQETCPHPGQDRKTRFGKQFCGQCSKPLDDISKSVFVVALLTPNHMGIFLAWDQEADEPLVFDSVDDAREEAFTLAGWEKFAIVAAAFDEGGKITVDYDRLAWQTFPPKAAKQHSR